MSKKHRATCFKPPVIHMFNIDKSGGFAFIRTLG